MRKIKTIDDITKDGKVEFGEGYEFVGTAEEADAILMRSTDLHFTDVTFKGKYSYSDFLKNEYSKVSLSKVSRNLRLSETL